MFRKKKAGFSLPTLKGEASSPQGVKDDERSIDDKFHKMSLRKLRPSQ